MFGIGRCEEVWSSICSGEFYCFICIFIALQILLVLLKQDMYGGGLGVCSKVEHDGYDKHEVWGDHVETQHAWERWIQIIEVTQHLLSGRNESSWQPGLLLRCSTVQVCRVVLQSLNTVIVLTVAHDCPLVEMLNGCASISVWKVFNCLSMETRSTCNVM